MQLAIRDVSKNFGGLVALDRCTFTCEGGSITGLVGPNGSGKSTIFNVVTGVIAPTSGDVELSGRRLTGMRPHQIARRGIGRSFQTTRLFRSLTVLDNVMLGGAVGTTPASTGEALEWLDRFGLRAKAEVTADALSFGQQRLVELARALIAKPVFMLLDEPFAGLSPAMAAELKSHIVGLPARGIGVILIEHNLAMVMELCPRILVLHQGRIIADGTPDAIRADKLVAEAYLGAPMLLRLEGVVAGYGAMDVLHGVDLSIDAGETVAILGPNGAGKSVLLKTMSGLLPARAGRIAFGGQDVTALRAAERARLGLALLPQSGVVFAAMTVEENLLMGVYAEADGARRRAALDRIYQRYPAVAAQRRRSAGALSGGQQKMVGLARAMMAAPQMLLLDEPSIGLDPKALASLANELAALDVSGMTLVLVEQNLRFALDCAPRTCFLELGRIASDGPSARFADTGDLLSLYFGKSTAQPATTLQH